MDWIERVEIKLISMRNFPEDGEGFYAPLHIPGECFCGTLYESLWPYKWVQRNGLLMSYPYVYISVNYYTTNQRSEMNPALSVRVDLINFHKMEHQLTTEQTRHTLLVAHHLGKRIIIDESVIQAFELYFSFYGKCKRKDCTKRILFRTLRLLYRSQMKTPRRLFDMARTNFIGQLSSMHEAVNKSLYQRYLFDASPGIKACFPLTFACVYAKINHHIPDENIAWSSCDPTNPRSLKCFCKTELCIMDSAPPVDSDEIQLVPCAVMTLPFFENRILAQLLFANVSNICYFQRDDPVLKEITAKYNYDFCRGSDCISDYFDFIELIGLAEMA